MTNVFSTGVIAHPVARAEHDDETIPAHWAVQSYFWGVHAGRAIELVAMTAIGSDDDGDFGLQACVKHVAEVALPFDGRDVATSGDVTAAFAVSRDGEMTMRMVEMDVATDVPVAAGETTGRAVGLGVSFEFGREGAFYVPWVAVESTGIVVRARLLAPYSVNVLVDENALPAGEAVPAIIADLWERIGALGAVVTVAARKRHYRITKVVRGVAAAAPETDVVHHPDVPPLAAAIAPSDEDKRAARTARKEAEKAAKEAKRAKARAADVVRQIASEPKSAEPKSAEGTEGTEPTVDAPAPEVSTVPVLQEPEVEPPAPAQVAGDPDSEDQLPGETDDEWLERLGKIEDARVAAKLLADTNAKEEARIAALTPKGKRKAKKKIVELEESSLCDEPEASTVGAEA